MACVCVGDALDEKVLWSMENDFSSCAFLDAWPERPEADHDVI